VTNLVFVFVFSIICFSLNVYEPNDYTAYAFASVEIVFSALAVGLMLKTKSLRLRRLEENMMPLDQSNQKISATYINEGCITITLEYRINKKNEVVFRLSAGKISTRVKRNLKEFLQIEDYLIKYLDCKMPELRSMIPSISKSKISSYSRDHTSLYENRLRSIDKFLHVICDTPELWTRDILIFLGIDKGSDQTIYLQKRSESLQRKNKGIKRNDNPNFGNPFDLPIEDCSEGSYM
jgi:hypothetical protein